MLIILEGPDCSGKTTFANRIAATLKRAEPDADVQLWHSDVPWHHPLQEYVDPLLTYRPETGRHYVCDRWHVGETVYPRLLNRSTQQSNAVRTYVEQFLRSRGALLVYCYAQQEHLYDCGVARGDDQRDLDLVGDQLHEFNRATAESLLRKMVVNVSDSADQIVDDLVVQVVGFASDEAKHASSLNRFTTYVGPARPKLLLLGDRRGPDDTDLADYGPVPAFAPYSGTSGQYLFDVLTRTDLRVAEHGRLLSEIGVANACDVDDPLDLWKALGRPETVALGIKSHRALRAAHVPYRRAPHPQYVRRFQHSRQKEYLLHILGVEVAA